MAETAEREPGRKTILVVDDDPGILQCVLSVLAELDYHMLSSGNGAEALAKSKVYKDDIHLLLSDFEMPGLSGVALATAMTADRPALKVLLMSGFTDGMLVLNEGWHFLAKPFVGSQLRALVSGLIWPDQPEPFSK